MIGKFAHLLGYLLFVNRVIRTVVANNSNLPCRWREFARSLPMLGRVLNDAKPTIEIWYKAKVCIRKILIEHSPEH